MSDNENANLAVLAAESQPITMNDAANGASTSQEIAAQLSLTANSETSLSPDPLTFIATANVAFDAPASNSNAVVASDNVTEIGPIPTSQQHDLTSTQAVIVPGNSI